MNRKLSSRIVPDLSSRLKQSGLLTAIVTLDSLRFRGYLKKPGSLLNDRWTFVEKDDSPGVLYRLGDERGVFQELAICRRSKTVTLSTVDRRAGRRQVILYSLVEKAVIRNEVVHELPSSKLVHSYLFLNREEGFLKRIASEDLAA